MRDRIAPTRGWICVTLLSALVTLSTTAAPVACAAAAAPAAAGRSMPAADARSAAPSALSPAAALLDVGAAARFYGCLDWHSHVHGHWLLARLISALQPKR